MNIRIESNFEFHTLVPNKTVIAPFYPSFT